MVLEDVEDCYAYYVLILGLSENLFWEMDLAGLVSIVSDKAAYDGWLASERARLMAK